MFKWTIVQEAKRKKKDDKDTEINEDEIAKKDEDEEEDDLEETDYTEDEVDLDDEDLEEDETSIDEDDVAQDIDGDEIPDDEEGTDYTEDETADDDMSDDTSGGDEIPDDEEGTDYTEDETADDEAGDDMSDDTSGGDDMINNTAPTNTGNPNDIRNASLIYDYIQLYNTIKSIITKVNSMNKTDILRNKTIIQVSKNLNILLNTLHKYIIKSFDKNSYVFNLYQFNLFIHAINVNIEMIKKNNELVSKG